VNDHELAASLATEAGEILLKVRVEYADADQKERKDAGDRRAQEFLAAALAQARPDDAVLSEEAVDNPVRLRADRVWIVDPLDGTREFSEAGRVDWAVHVALWRRNGSGSNGSGAAGEPAGHLIAGAVALPAQGVTFSTPDVPPIPEAGAVPRIIVSRTRPPAVALEVCEALGGTLVEMGSAGAKMMAVIQGQADIYVHAGGQYEWDSAAPVAVVRAAGLHSSRIDGSPLVYNQADTYLPDLVICRPEYAEDVLRITSR
jgi:3'(2'), 5'-bisphosphate nucleotidase